MARNGLVVVVIFSLLSHGKPHAVVVTGAPPVVGEGESLELVTKLVAMATSGASETRFEVYGRTHTKACTTTSKGNKEFCGKINIETRRSTTPGKRVILVQGPC